VVALKALKCTQVHSSALKALKCTLVHSSAHKSTQVPTMPHRHTMPVWCPRAYIGRKQRSVKNMLIALWVGPLYITHIGQESPSVEEMLR